LDVELPALGQRDNAATDRVCLRPQRIQSSNHLHARRTLGGETMTDPIIDEIRRIRDAHAARFHYDLDAIFQDIKEQEKRSGRTFVSFTPPRITPHEARQPTGAATAVSDS